MCALDVNNPTSLRWLIKLTLYTIKFMCVCVVYVCVCVFVCGVCVCARACVCVVCVYLYQETRMESEASLFFPWLEVLTVHAHPAMRMCNNVHS